MCNNYNICVIIIIINDLFYNSCPGPLKCYDGTDSKHHTTLHRQTGWRYGCCTVKATE